MPIKESKLSRELLQLDLILMQMERCVLITLYLHVNDILIAARSFMR